MNTSALMHQKFSDQSAGGQWATLLTIMALLTGSFGGLVLWAADARIDQKYATDKDVRSVQAEVAAQVQIITETVQQNTRTVQATATSVDGLTLVVLDLRIRDLDDEIFDLQRDKIRGPGSWSDRDERGLRDRLSGLADLRIQRDRLFTRILEATE